MLCTGGGVNLAHTCYSGSPLALGTWKLITNCVWASWFLSSEIADQQSHSMTANTMDW